jgi:hypothetical protein
MEPLDLEPAMERAQQSEGGEGWSLSTPPELERPLTLSADPRGGHDALLTAEKLLTAAPRSASTADNHGKFSEEVHNYVREHIRNADQKATFFFAALTAILAFLNTQNVPRRWLKDVRQWSFLDGLGFVSMLGLAVGAGVLLSVIFPRLKGSRRGILFFNAIAEYDSASEYADDVLTRPANSLVRTKLQHCYDLSMVCSAKYRMLRIGFWVGSIGAATALLFLLLAKSGSQ